MSQLPSCCMLSQKYNTCTQCACAHCGWNRAEAEFRKNLRKTNGLTKCIDGTKALRLPFRVNDRAE